MKKCLILDYGVGNIASVRTFFRDNGYTVSFGRDIDEIRIADLLVLPGVGSYETAAENVKLSNLTDEIRNRHSAEKPILGICLGFQLLTKSSTESPFANGLGILNGRTIRLKEISQIGWGRLKVKGDLELFSNDYFFFNHSFGIYDLEDVSLSAGSGLSNYSALAVQQKTVGVQFHPERSQESGKKLLRWLEKETWDFHD
jgi:glutamine amidotransferase